MTTGTLPASGHPAVEGSRAVFDDFAKFAADAITPMSVETPCKQGFFANYSASRLDRLNFVEIEAPALRVHHEASHRTTRTFQLLYSVKTGLDISVPGKRFHLGPGELCLLDNSKPYTVAVDGPHKVLDMIVPENWLAGWIGAPHLVTSRPVSLTTKWGPPLASFLNTLSAEILAGDIPARAIEHQFGGLASLALRCLTLEQPPIYCEAMARRAIELIRARYDDPELTGVHIAKALGVAPRTLQKVLATTGRTYQKLLGEMRIARAKEILSDPTMRRLNIAQVAYKAGFVDHAYFSRVFTKNTGLPPTHWRDRNCGIR